MSRWLVLLAVLIGTSMACSNSPASTADAGPDGPDLAVRPPTDPTTWGAWLDTGNYLAWHCEDEPHPAREPSPHGMNRICQNSIVTQALSGNGNYPVDSSMVKEQYNGSGEIFAVEISLRETDAEGNDAWRFWRGTGEQFDTITNNRTGSNFCSDCHTDADRDFIFTNVE